MKKDEILELLKGDVDIIIDLVNEVNGWDGSLDEYEYMVNDEDFLKHTLQAIVR